MAAKADRVKITKIPTGVPGLDVVIGGGFPAYSVNIFAGPPGAGKTTLIHQFLFHNAGPDAKTLYFVALGEPTLKMLRYQQQYDFFDSSKIETGILYQDIGTVGRDEGLGAVLELIAKRVIEEVPAFVVIDSFRGLKEIGEARAENVRTFVHDLSSMLGAWNVTSFLLGEYIFQDVLSLPEFSAADGIIWLTREVAVNAVTRKLEVVKMRGQGSLPGKHSFRITEAGVEVFPRMVPIEETPELPIKRDRVKFGITGLDEMMDGGIPRGETTLIAGSSGTGKTLMALHLIAEGVRVGEPSIMVTFEENPREHERKALSFGWDLPAWEKKGLVGMIYLRPMDLSVDEVLARVHDMTRKLKAKRVIINSVSGFELVISPSDEPEFREALFRLLATLSREGVTTVMTTEIPSVFGDFRISPEHVSFLADNIVVLRYAEIESQLRKVLMVVKMRTSRHDKDLRQYQITDKGISVERPFTGYSGVLSGIPTLRALIEPQPVTAGLSEQEESLMHVLLALREATAEQLADSMAIDIDQVRKMLDKLVDTGYVARLGTRAAPRYRVALVTAGVAPRRR